MTEAELVDLLVPTFDEAIAQIDVLLLLVDLLEMCLAESERMAVRMVH